MSDIIIMWSGWVVAVFILVGLGYCIHRALTVIEKLEAREEALVGALGKFGIKVTYDE